MSGHAATLSLSLFPSLSPAASSLLSLSRTLRVHDVKDCRREIISFINQRPYVSASSHLIPPAFSPAARETSLSAIPSSLSSAMSPCAASWKGREKWLRFINDGLCAARKFSSRRLKTRERTAVFLRTRGNAN